MTRRRHGGRAKLARRFRFWIPGAVGFAWLLSGSVRAENPFRVLPYLQNPATNQITVMWFSESGAVGNIAYGSAENLRSLEVPGVAAGALDYHASEADFFPGGEPPGKPYLHRVRLTGLLSGMACPYVVTQDGMSITNTFRTAPPRDHAVRFVVYADAETEPESTGVSAAWPSPEDGSHRLYPVDQTRGYRENLLQVQAFDPDFIVIAGDLVQSGGEQRDWDEFWRHNAGDLNHPAGAAPILPVPGNHEYYGGTRGGYGQPASEQSVAKYLAYFEMPPNGATDPDHEGRYYRLDYGPVTLVFLDLCNGEDETPVKDTSAYMNTADGCRAPDFNPGTAQYAWLETQLASAQSLSEFTFVVFHQAPYSVGPHGVEGEAQSGVPARVLTPLFLRYGVDSVFSGHDEMFERSVVTGEERRPDGSVHPATVHFYDVGIGGDGLRAPQPDLDNPFQAFLAHDDAPEVWSGAQLVSGGKHYGHLEVRVQTNALGRWEAVLTPVMAFPLMDEEGAVTDLEGRTYADGVTIESASALPPESRKATLMEWVGKTR